MTERCDKRTTTTDTIWWGWQCPICGGVYSPLVMECPKCNSPRYSFPETTDGKWGDTK